MPRSGGVFRSRNQLLDQHHPGASRHPSFAKEGSSRSFNSFTPCRTAPTADSCPLSVKYVIAIRGWWRISAGAPGWSKHLMEFDLFSSRLHSSSAEEGTILLSCCGSFTPSWTRRITSSGEVLYPEASRTTPGCDRSGSHGGTPTVRRRRQPARDRCRLPFPFAMPSATGSYSLP